jgi:nucleotide-binding universal stress UspA family protein
VRDFRGTEGILCVRRHHEEGETGGIKERIVEGSMDAKKILIAVDSSDYAAKAVAYVGDIVGKAEGFSVRLLHVARPPERDASPDEEHWRACCREEEEKMSKFLREAQEALYARGLPVEGVSEERLDPDGSSIAMNVLRVQQEGGFGTIVVGRRGVSKAEEFLFGSVSSRVVHHAKDCAVWVVG